MPILVGLVFSIWIILVMDMSGVGKQEPTNPPATTTTVCEKGGAK